MRILNTDTCVELLRGNAKVLGRRVAVEDEVATTWITAAELHFGACLSKEPESNRSLVNQFLETIDLLGLDRPSAQLFGERKAELQRIGERLADADLLIGSIVVTRQAVLVTGKQPALLALQGDPARGLDSLSLRAPRRSS